MISSIRVLILKHKSNGDTNFFEIVARILLDIFAPYLLIICQDFVLRTSIDLIKENGLILKKSRSRWYPAETITDEGYADDLVLLENTPAQDECLPRSLEHAARGVGLYMNSDFM